MAVILPYCLPYAPISTCDRFKRNTTSNLQVVIWDDLKLRNKHTKFFLKFSPAGLPLALPTHWKWLERLEPCSQNYKFSSLAPLKFKARLQNSNKFFSVTNADTNFFITIGTLWPYKLSVQLTRCSPYHWESFFQQGRARWWKASEGFSEELAGQKYASSLSKGPTNESGGQDVYKTVFEPTLLPTPKYPNHKYGSHLIISKRTQRLEQRLCLLE